MNVRLNPPELTDQLDHEPSLGQAVGDGGDEGLREAASPLREEVEDERGRQSINRTNGWCSPGAVTAAGGTHLCLDKVEPGEAWRLIREEGVTHFNAAPTVLTDLAYHRAAEDGSPPRRSRVGTGGRHRRRRCARGWPSSRSTWSTSTGSLNLRARGDL